VTPGNSRQSADQRSTPGNIQQVLKSGIWPVRVGTLLATLRSHSFNLSCSHWPFMIWSFPTLRCHSASSNMGTGDMVCNFAAHLTHRLALKPEVVYISLHIAAYLGFFSLLIYTAKNQFKEVRSKKSSHQPHPYKKHASL